MKYETLKARAALTAFKVTLQNKLQRNELDNVDYNLLAHSAWLIADAFMDNRPPQVGETALRAKGTVKQKI